MLSVGWEPNTGASFSVEPSRESTEKGASFVGADCSVLTAGMPELAALSAFCLASTAKLILVIKKMVARMAVVRLRKLDEPWPPNTV